MYFNIFRVVEMLSSLLLEEGNNNILNKKRFYEEFNSGEIAMPRRNPKPEDYEKTFAGDTDDNFKIGISVTKKSLKARANFNQLYLEVFIRQSSVYIFFLSNSYFRISFTCSVEVTILFSRER